MAATTRACSPRAYPGAAASLPELQDKAAGAGSLNWLPEHDQIIRRMPMVVQVGDKLYPSFAADMLRLAQGASTYVVKSSGASSEKAFGEKTGIVKVRIGDYEVPTEADGEMWIRFTKQAKERYLPAWSVLNGEIGKDEIEGRLAIIGTSAAGLLDLRATPLEAAVPGVELHAQAIEQILQGSFLQRPDFATPAELLYILVLGLLIALLIYRLGAAGSAVAWRHRRGRRHRRVLVRLPMPWAGWSIRSTQRSRSPRSTSPERCSYSCAPSASATACAMPSAITWRRRLVERLADDPSRLKLGGETRDMTLLFSDVRGFTTISEGLDAEELTHFLNSLFTPLSKIILEEQGTIDKFMGDAVMAFWNAPLDDSEHATHACQRGACASCEQMPGLNEHWRDEAEAKGRSLQPGEDRHRAEHRDLLRRQSRLGDALRLFGDRRQRQCRLAARRPVEDL